MSYARSSSVRKRWGPSGRSRSSRSRMPCSRLPCSRFSCSKFSGSVMRAHAGGGYTHALIRAFSGSARPSPSACSLLPCFTAAQAWRCPSTARARYSSINWKEIHCFTDTSTDRTTAHLTEAPAQRPEVPGAHLPRAGHEEDEGDPDQHGGDRAARGGARAGREDGQLLPQQGDAHTPA